MAKYRRDLVASWKVPSNILLRKNTLLSKRLECVLYCSITAANMKRSNAEKMENHYPWCKPKTILIQCWIWIIIPTVGPAQWLKAQDFHRDNWTICRSCQQISSRLVKSPTGHLENVLSVISGRHTICNYQYLTVYGLGLLYKYSVALHEKNCCLHVEKHANWPVFHLTQELVLISDKLSLFLYM